MQKCDKKFVPSPDSSKCSYVLSKDPIYFDFGYANVQVQAEFSASSDIFFCLLITLIRPPKEHLTQWKTVKNMVD